MRKLSTIQIAFALCALAWSVIVLRAIFVETPKRETIASEAALTAFAKTKLDDLQEQSFAGNREYCGLIFEDDEGTLSVSDISAGSTSACSFSWQVPFGLYAIASFHTHGGFDRDYDGEAPSLLDLETDFDERIDGFISTPGGRLWHIDWDVEIATQVCGENCLSQDPKYEPCDGFLPEQEYSLAELRERARSDSGEC